MSSFHSLKSSADTRLMPGGRCSWICVTELNKATSLNKEQVSW